MAADSRRRHRRRDRHAVGGLRAARAARPHHRRRGARRLVQTGREPALQRSRCRRGARAARRGAGRSGLGDAVDGELPPRDERKIRAGRPRTPGPRPAARLRDRRRHARRVRGRGAGRHSQPPAARGDRGETRPAGAGGRPAQSAGILDLRLLPAVCRNGRLSQLQRLARRARRGHRIAPRPVSLLQLFGARAERVSLVRRPVHGAGGLRHRTGRTRADRALPVGPRGSRRPGHDQEARRPQFAADALPQRRDRRHGRHPDDRERARLSGSDAGWRGVG